MSQDLIEALHTDMPGQRYQAAITIFQEINPPYDEGMLIALIAALGDQHVGVRTYAVKALIKANKTATQAIWEHLTSLTNPRHVTACVEVLGADQSMNGSYPTLMHLYRNGVGEVRVAVLQAISRHHLPGDVSFLVEALSDRNAQVRYYAALGLARPGLSKAPQALIDATQGDAVLVRGAALYALGQIGDPQAIDAIVSALRVSIEDTNVDPAETAVAGRPMSSEQYRRFMASHGQVDLPAIATHALTRLGTPIVPTLQELLNDGEPKMRLCAAWAIGLMGDVQLIEDNVRPLLDDASARVRALAATFVKKMTK